MKKQIREFLSMELRMLVRKIYNNECAYCGSKKELHIHHRDKDPSNNDVSNLMLLCNFCHTFIEHPHMRDKYLQRERQKFYKSKGLIIKA